MDHEAILAEIGDLRRRVAVEANRADAEKERADAAEEALAALAAQTAGPHAHEGGEG